MPLAKASPDHDRFLSPAQQEPIALTGVWLERWVYYRQQLEQLAVLNGGQAQRDGLNLALHAPVGRGQCVHIVVRESEAGRAGVLAGPITHDAVWTLEDDNPYDDLWDVVEATIAGRMIPSPGENSFQAEFADQHGGVAPLWRVPHNIESWRAPGGKAELRYPDGTGVSLDVVRRSSAFDAEQGKHWLLVTHDGRKPEPGYQIVTDLPEGSYEWIAPPDRWPGSGQE